MKNRGYIILAGALIFSLAFNAQNQKKKNSISESSSSGGKAFNESTKVINVGVGFLGAYYYRYNRGQGYSYRQSPAFNLSYEQGIGRKTGPGVIGVGLYFGYQSARWQYDNYYYKGVPFYYRHSWRYTTIAARGAYHLDALTTDKGELYFGALLGLQIRSYTFSSNSPDPDVNSYRINQGNVGTVGSIFLGGRYYFTDNIGLFGELGYGVTYLTLGLSVKF
jgi:hypothetical protein